MALLSKNQKLLVSRRKIEFFVLRNRMGFEAFCPTCRRECRFVAVEEAMALTGGTMLSTFAAVTSGKLHHIESNSGVLLICQESLAGKSGRELSHGNK